MATYKQIQTYLYDMYIAKKIKFNTGTIEELKFENKTL